MAASAKQFDPTDPWVLVIDLRIPTPDQDSGSVRMYAILRLLVEMGFRITFVSDSEEHLPHYREALEKQGIGILYGSGAAHKHLAAVGASITSYCYHGRRQLFGTCLMSEHTRYIPKLYMTLLTFTGYDSSGRC